MMRGKLRKKEKTEKQRGEEEEDIELMGTAERGEEEIYQETHVIFNDPCMWRGEDHTSSFSSAKYRSPNLISCSIAVL